MTINQKLEVWDINGVLPSMTAYSFKTLPRDPPLNVSFLLVGVMPKHLSELNSTVAIKCHDQFLSLILQQPLNAMIPPCIQGIIIWEAMNFVGKKGFQLVYYLKVVLTIECLQLKRIIKADQF